LTVENFLRSRAPLSTGHAVSALLVLEDSRTAMEQTAAANIRTAYERGPPQTYRSIFDRRLKKSPRLYVEKPGWPKGGFPASRTWTTSHAARSL